MFKLNRISAACAAVAGLVVAVPCAHAQISGDVIRIGFITDLSGLYADIDGPAGVEMVKQAIADMGGSINGKKVELLVADHQNKPDVAASQGPRVVRHSRVIDMLIAGTNSGTNARHGESRGREEEADDPGRSAQGAQRADQRAVLAVDHPLRIRHRGARARCTGSADRQERAARAGIS